MPNIMENCNSSEKSRFLPIQVPSLCWQLTCYKRTTQLVPLPAANCPGLPGPTPGHDLCPVHRDSLCAQGAKTLSKHCHTPGLISLFLPTLLLPAVSSPCSQKAKKPAASISAAAPQSLFVINFTKGLGSPAPFHVPDSGEIMTVNTAKALSGGISAPWYVHVRVHMCLWSHVHVKETDSSTQPETDRQGSHALQILNWPEMVLLSFDNLFNNWELSVCPGH